MYGTMWISLQDHAIFETVKLHKQMYGTMWISFQDHGIFIKLSYCISKCVVLCRFHFKTIAFAGL